MTRQFDKYPGTQRPSDIKYRYRDAFNLALHYEYG